MATPSKETVIKFKADTAEYKQKIEALNQSNRALKQELKLVQTEMKLTGSNTEKFKASLSSLEKQYEVAKQKTKETADQLERTKRVWGDNATETKKAEEALRRAKIAEGELSNKIKITTEDLKKAKEAEALRNSEIGKSKQTLDSLKQSQTGLQMESQKLKTAYDLELASLGKKASETSKAKLQYDYLKQAQANAAQTTQNLAQQLNAAKTAFGANSKEVKELEIKLMEAQRAEKELAVQTNAVAKKVGTAFREAGSHVKEFGNKLKDVGNSMKHVGKDMTMKVTTPIAAGMTYAAKEASKFDHEMADVRKEVNATGLSASQVDAVMGKMWDASLAGSQKFGVSTEKINEGFLVLVKDGYSAEEAISIMNTSLYTAQGANEDLLTTVDGLGSAFEATGQKTNDAKHNIDGINHMADVFAYTANHTKASVHSLNESMSIIGPTAAAAGQPLEVTASAVGTLQSNGVEASVAARALKSGFVNLVKPTKAMGNAMDDMKLKTHDANGNMKQLPQILDEMEAGMKGWTQEQRNAALATIFGKEHLASWQILVHKGGKDLNKMADDAKNATGEVKHLSDQMRDTPENQFKRLQQTLHSIAVTFGTEILPALMPVVQEVQKFVEWIANLDSGTKQMILTIAAVVAVVGPLVILLGSLISAFGTIVTAAGSVISIFGGLGTATAAVGTASVGAAAGVGGIGAALGAATLAAAPWIAAAVAVGAAGYGIYKALNEEAIPAVDLFKERVTYAADGTVQSVDKISESTQKAVGSFMDMAEQANSTTVTMFAQQTQITDENLPQIIAKYEDMKNQVVNAFEQKKQNAVTKTQEAFQGVQTVTAEEQANILTMYDQHFEMEKSKTQSAKDKIVEIWNKAKEEKRALTADENKQIQNLQDVFNQQAIRAMAENKAEQEVILNNLKNSKERMNAEMLSDAVKKINQTHDKTVEKAREERDKRVKQAEMMKAELGSKAEGTANKLISEANKQYEKVKDSADKTKRDGIDKLKGSYKDLESQVDTSTGNILTYWDKIKRWWNNWTPVKKVMEVFSTGGQEAQRSAKNTFSAPKSFAPAREEASSSPLRAFKGFQSPIPPEIPEQMNKIRKARAVPSVRENEVLSQALFGQGILSNLPHIANSAMAMATGKQRSFSQPTQPAVEGSPVEMNFYTTVRNERDIDRLFEKADDWMAQKGRNINIARGRNG